MGNSASTSKNFNMYSQDLVSVGTPKSEWGKNHLKTSHNNFHCVDFVCRL